MASPIERMLIAAILEGAERNRVSMADYTPWSCSGAFDPTFGHLLLAAGPHGVDLDIDWYGGSVGDCEEWSLYGDIAIDSYRIDLIVCTTYGTIAIECDGHDFHDRTKQQAAYDRARDRWFLARGLATARFTGSEIHHSVEKCVAEIYDIARAVDAVDCSLTHGGIHKRGLELVKVYSHG